MQYMEPNYSLEDAINKRSAFYEWVGRCIKRWADLEGYVYELADWAINGERSISAIVFFRTPSFEARLTLTSDLLKRSLRDEKRDREKEPTNLERWTKLEKDIRALMDFRNALAHQPATKSYGRLLGTKRPEEVSGTDWHDQAMVTTQHHADRQRRPSRFKEISIDDMKAHHAAITKLTMTAYHLQHYIGRKNTPLARRPEHRPQGTPRDSLPAPKAGVTKARFRP